MQLDKFLCPKFSDCCSEQHILLGLGLKWLITIFKLWRGQLSAHPLNVFSDSIFGNDIFLLHQGVGRTCLQCDLLQNKNRYSQIIFNPLLCRRIKFVKNRASYAIVPLVHRVSGSALIFVKTSFSWSSVTFRIKRSFQADALRT